MIILLISALLIACAIVIISKICIKITLRTPLSEFNYSTLEKRKYEKRFEFLHSVGLFLMIVSIIMIIIKLSGNY